MDRDALQKVAEGHSPIIKAAQPPMATGHKGGSTHEYPSLHAVLEQAERGTP